MSIISIANQAQLVAALSKAVGGETFVLAPGDYGSVTISGRNFSAPVTLQSQSTVSMAHLDGLTIKSSTNIAVKSLDVGRAMTAAEQDFGKMVSVFDSKNITLDHVKIHGTLDNNPRNDGWGLYVTDSSNVGVTNSDFTELHRGTVFQRSDHVTVEANSFYKIRSDGTDFTAVDTVLIKDNQYRDFYMIPGDHPDAIQIWTQGQTRASANITITGNQVFQGDGLGLQGIHLRDEVGNMPFKNVKIDNNILYGNDLWHGIHVDHGQGVSITNNTVVSRTTDNPVFWINVQNVNGVTIQKNVTDIILSDDRVSGANISDNIELRGNHAATALIPHLNNNAATTIADLLFPGYGYHGSSAAPSPAPTPSPTPAPTPSPAPAPAPSPSPSPDAIHASAIYGTAGSETVRGTSASEKIFGVGAHDSAPGRNSSDKLFGGGGADTFILGDQRGTFYDGGIKNQSGRWDYAQIRDFSSDDRIQLSGKLSDYVFRLETVNGIVGTAILKDSNGNHKWDKLDELIGHVAGVKNLSSASLVFVPESSAHPDASPQPAKPIQLPIISHPPVVSHPTPDAPAHASPPIELPMHSYAPIVSSGLLAVISAQHFAIA